jgi:phenylacetate-coenzyme A ligase PaaK-like adenylate-forming protein
MNLVDELLARRTWSRDQLAEHQRRALRETVRHAVERSPYYREALGPDAATDDVALDDLPTLSKATLIDEWDRIVTDPRLRLRDVEHHLAGSPGAAPYLGEFRLLLTGGSTGMRAVFVQGRRDFELTMACSLRPAVDAGIRPELRLASILSPSPYHLSNQVSDALRAGREGSPRLDVTMPLDRIVTALEAYRPDVITAYPSILGLLADEQLHGRLQIEPRILATGSEALTDEVRARAREAWGLEVVDIYASTEGAVMASECPAHCGRHVWEDMVILEPVDEHNRPVPPGTPSHKVLLTNLLCRTQPLIRYELADSVTFAEGPNPAGRPFARIGRIDGRSADILRLPASGGGEVAIHPFHLRAPFSRLPEIRQYQLAQTQDRLTVRIVLRPGAARETPGRVAATLSEALAAAGAVPPPVDVEPVAELPRTGNGAKLTLVASR